MLKTLTLSNYDIVFHETEINKDYNTVVYFTPQTPDEALFGVGVSTIVIPYTHGLVDTTINKDDYYCTVIFDDEVKNTIGKPNILFSFFTKKLKKEFTAITPDEPAKPAQFLDKHVGTGFKGIKSPSGTAYINISDDIIELAVGDNKWTISKDQITDYSQQVKHALPDDSQGGIFTETGIFRFLPKCFLPPFAMPSYMPDVKLILLLASNIDVIKEMGEILDGKE